MDRKFLAFDLAVAKVVPDGDGLNAHRPLGISCAAMLLSDSRRSVTWHGRTPNGGATGRMGPEESKVMVQTLVGKVNEGYILVTWNGLSFGLPALAEESGLESECELLSSRHVDMMFHVYCVKGQYLNLKTAATGMGLQVKAQGMAVRDGPRLWAQGEHQQVLDHLARNLRTTIDLALICEQRKVFLWITRRGSSQGMDLPFGWLTVPEAARIKGIDHTQWQWDR